MSASDDLHSELDRILAGAQAERRLPSVSAAVFRDGEVIWRRALGLADFESAVDASPEHAYRLGSITKTFTAVCVLQLRDAGLVELDAPLHTYVPEAPAGATVRQALSHLSGIQREPPGEIWETLEPPSREQLWPGGPSGLVVRPGGPRPLPRRRGTRARRAAARRPGRTGRCTKALLRDLPRHARAPDVRAERQLKRSPAERNSATAPP